MRKNKSLALKRRPPAQQIIRMLRNPLYICLAQVFVIVYVVFFSGILPQFTQLVALGLAIFCVFRFLELWPKELLSDLPTELILQVFAWLIFSPAYTAMMAKFLIQKGVFTKQGFALLGIEALILSCIFFGAGSKNLPKWLQGAFALLLLALFAIGVSFAFPLNEVAQ